MLLDGPVSPMLCSPGREPPAGEGWVLEPKWDGIRAIAQVTETGPRLFTRRGRGHDHRFPRINAALAVLPVGTVLDGELACRSRTDGCASAAIVSARSWSPGRRTGPTPTASPSRWSCSTRWRSAAKDQLCTAESRPGCGVPGAAALLGGV